MDIDLERAIMGFKLSNEARGLSPKTIAGYQAGLMLFRKWMEKDLGHPPKIEEVTTDHIRRYCTGMRTTAVAYEGHPYHPEEAHPLTAASACHYYRNVSVFFNWAMREELIIKSPMKNVPRPKVPKFLPDPFSEEEIRALFKACKSLPDSSCLRAIAILMVLLDTGVRLGELVHMKLHDLDVEQGRIKVFGKGAKERYVYLGNSARRALWRYVSLARAEPVLGGDYLFLCEDGHPITDRYLAHILEKVSKAAGVKKVHPHRFRRTAAIQFLRNGGNIFALQKILGHETLDMVRHYVNLATDDVAVAHKQASPVDGWRL